MKRFKQAIPLEEIEETEAFGGRYYGKQEAKDTQVGLWLAILVFSLVATVSAGYYAIENMTKPTHCHQSAAPEETPAKPLNILGPIREHS